MPQTEVRAFRASDGTVPIQEWLDEREQREPKAYAKCLARILELADVGSEMRRPHADHLREKFASCEPRFDACTIEFFTSSTARMLLYYLMGITKEDAVPPREIDRAIEHMKLVKKAPDRYTADLELE